MSWSWKKIDWHVTLWLFYFYLFRKKYLCSSWKLFLAQIIWDGYPQVVCVFNNVRNHIKNRHTAMSHSVVTIFHKVTLWNHCQVAILAHCCTIAKVHTKMYMFAFFRNLYSNYASLLRKPGRHHCILFWYSLKHVVQKFFEISHFL